MDAAGKNVEIVCKVLGNFLQHVGIKDAAGAEKALLVRKYVHRHGIVCRRRRVLLAAIRKLGASGKKQIGQGIAVPWEQARRILLGEEQERVFGNPP